MSNIMLNSPGNTVEGRIERLQIMRSDGTIRESKEVNIHNTIVNCGLDNILTVGGFDQGSNINDISINIGFTNNDYATGYYYIAQWIRMLWFMKIGTDHNDNITLYDMTDLVEPYVNSVQETFSQSHYIPTTENLAVRGTTYDSMTTTDIHSTHRITSNSIKVTEDNTEITEVGFFVGINKTYYNSWGSQKFTPGDMFCRIALGENKVTLNAGERLVVTYALSEYADPKHQAINDIHLVDSNGDPIKFKDENNVEHTIGAIARVFMCDGRLNGSNLKLPGDFTCIHPTADRGYIIGRSVCIYDNHYYVGISLPIYGRMGCYNYDADNGSSDYRNISNATFYKHKDRNSLPCRDGNFKLAYNINLYNDNNGSTYNSVDEYGFPSINTKTNMSRGSYLIMHETDTSTTLLLNAGKCNDNNTNPTPRNNYTGVGNSHSNIYSSPTIKPYTRGTFYRDQEWVMPTYQPNFYGGSTNTLPDPRYTASIYWINIRGMLYKIGYFTEEGNLSTFVPCPIYKKRGQVFRVTFREHVGRHIAGA